MLRSTASHFARRDGDVALPMQRQEVSFFAPLPIGATFRLSPSLQPTSFLSAPLPIDAEFAHFRPFATVVTPTEPFEEPDADVCGLCCGEPFVWSCPADRTKTICVTCIEKMVAGMEPGPLLCTCLGACEIPASIVQLTAASTFALYQQRRSADDYARANHWKQLVVQALLQRRTPPSCPYVPSPIPLLDRQAEGEIQTHNAMAARAWQLAVAHVDQILLAHQVQSNDLNKVMSALLDESLAIACQRAKMCPRCNFGPVLNVGCNDLIAHHQDERHWSNACRGCGFFHASADAWLPWDFVNRPAMTSEAGDEILSTAAFETKVDRSCPSTSSNEIV